MIKEKTDFYNKAKELRKAMEKDGKIKYRYGAGIWYEKVKGMGEKVFSPDLALQLWEEDESIRDLYDKLESKIVNLENEARKIDIHLNTKEKQLILKDDVEIIKFDGSKEMADRYGLENIIPDLSNIFMFDCRMVNEGDYIIAKNGKAVYITNFPFLDIFKLNETEL